MGFPNEAAKSTGDPIRLQIPQWQIFFCAGGWPLIIGGHVFGACAAIMNFDHSFHHPIGFALIALTLAYIYSLITAYYFIAAPHDRISIFEDAIIHETAFSIRRIEFKDILSLDWRQHTLRAVIQAPHARVSIWLNNYPWVKQTQVIRKLRSHVPRQLHKKYRKFRYAFGKYRVQPRELTKQDVREYAFLHAIVLVLVVIGIAADAQNPAENIFFAVAAAFVLAAIIYVWRKANFRRSRLGRAPNV